VAFDIGIDFRGTSGYVTDPASCTYCVTDQYPTVRGGATFGFVGTASGSLTGADLNNTYDARIAGFSYVTADLNFRLDLPASGSVGVRLATGNSGAVTGDVRIKDNATTLFSVSGTAGSGTFNDAQGVNYSAAAWPGSNSVNTQTFATTTLIAMLDSSGGYTDIVHLRVTQGSSSVTHATSGTLTGQGSVIAGTSLHKRKHLNTGAIVGAGSTVAGVAARKRQHATTGALVGSSAIAGTASRALIVAHPAAGVLVGASSAVAGTAAHKRKHITTGALVGHAAITGAALGPLPDVVVHVSGAPRRQMRRTPVQHSARGRLVARGAVVHGIAAKSFDDRNLLELLMIAT
jgi:hypothetical protein